MLASALLLALLQADSTTVCVVDAVTRAPVVGTRVHPVAASPSADSSGAVRMHASCARVPVGVLRVQRVGYRPALVTITGGESVSVIELVPLTASSTRLATVAVTSTRNDRRVGHVDGVLTVDEARTSGAATSAHLLERLPFTLVRSARGETGVSLRGARREQVVITLDGLPLNDPASGIADVADLPLAALGTATAVLGADPLGAGPGASGGVLALTTAAQKLVTLRTGTLGQRSAEAAWSSPMGRARWHASAMHRSAANDFTFDNDAGASGAPIREARVNNDERRSSAVFGVIADRWQMTALASRGDRGMVGPANVRTYDADRARTARLFVRAQASVRDMQLLAGVRRFSLAYRDPTRPVFDADARALAADAEVRGEASASTPHRLSLGWRLGGGHDEVRATGGLSQRRDRGFAMSQGQWRNGRVHAELGARLDLIDATGLLPSFSVAAERQLAAGWALSARASQAVRVPTLYDLYFSSPQRLVIRALRPERVTADLELASRWAHATAHADLALEVSLVSRDTRDAIVWFPGNFGWTPANVGVERLRGGEARLQVTPRWGAVSAWVTAYDAQLTTGTLRIPTPYVPRFAAGSQWRAQLRGVSASVLSRSIGRRPYSAGPRDRRYELPAVTLFDVAVTHALPRWIHPAHIASMATWSVENATDAAWQSVRGFPSPGRTWAIAFTLRHTLQP